MEGKTMKHVITIAVALLMLGSAFAKPKTPELAPVTPEGIQRAANNVSVLRSMMLDPDSFVLEKVQQDRFAPKSSGFVFGDKHPGAFPDVCYLFRSHNKMGGYGNTGVALLDGKGKLRIFDNTSDGDMIAAGFICDLKHPERNSDITEQVKAVLAPHAPTPVSPADAATKAQQYADCLKVAVENPSIVCKQ
jgi:hypothetical protein